MRARSFRVVPLAVLLVLAVSASATAASASAPVLVSPTAKTKLRKGKPFVFSVKAPVKGLIALRVSKSRHTGKFGLIGQDRLLAARTAQADGATVKVTVRSYAHLTSYFLNNRGTYWWQAYLVSCDVTHNANGCFVPSAPRKLVIR